jgi:YVTN family beta-propeller protein
MSTERIVIELRWDRRAAAVLALVVAVPLLAVTGLLTALAAHGGVAPASPAANTAPTTLSYQGQVSVNGQPFTGTGQFRFAIVSANGATTYWTNDGSLSTPPSAAVTLIVNGGVFTVRLGDTSLPGMTQPITAGLFTQPGRALRVWFNDGTHGVQQLAPDVALAAVPYALNAETLDGLDSSLFVQGGQGVSRLANDAGYLTSSSAGALFARNHPTPQQLALLKWYTAISTTQANISVGSGPVAVAFDGANMWVVNNNDATVSVLRASDGAHVMTPTVGGIPSGIAFDGANMWVTNSADNTVSVLRASDGSQVRTPGVGNVPVGIAFDGTNMWVVNRSDNSVSVLRASDGAHVMTPTVGTFPQTIAFDGANMWVVNEIDNSVSVLRASDGFHVMTPTVGSSPRAIAFDGTNMWVANEIDNSVSVLRASDGAHVMTPTVGSHPLGLALDGTNMWVTNFSSNNVSVLRASDGAHVMTTTVGSSPWGIAFDGANMWVANYLGNTVSKR